MPKCYAALRWFAPAVTLPGHFGWKTQVEQEAFRSHSASAPPPHLRDQNRDSTGGVSQIAMLEDGYAASLAERVKTSSIDELKTLRAFFDCCELPQRNAHLSRQVQEELERRGVGVP